LQSRDVYSWPEGAQQLVAPLLPETEDAPLAGRVESASSAMSQELEYDHNLDFMVRQPGWDGSDERSVQVWQAILAERDAQPSVGRRDEL
jgi:hypothetical protein